MKTLRIWIEYTARAETTVEVPDDFEIPKRFASWPDEWVGLCDEEGYKNLQVQNCGVEED